MAFLISVQLVDAYGRVSTKRYENDRTLIADAATDAAALVAALEAVSLAAVVKYDISQATAVNHSATAGANLDAGGTLHVTLASAKGAAIKIPAMDPTFVEADGSIDITDEAITDFVALFQSGGHFTISDGDLVSAIRSGELDR